MLKHNQVKNTLLNGLSIALSLAQYYQLKYYNLYSTVSTQLEVTTRCSHPNMSRAKGVTERGLQKEITLTATSFIHSKYKFVMIL